MSIDRFEGQSSLGLRIVRSIPGEDPLDQLFDRRREIVRVERVLLEPVCGVPGEHQVVVDLAAVSDVLQRLLDTEAARIGQSPGGVIVMILPR